MIEACSARAASLGRKAEQILEAAKTVFLRDGYEPTSMDAVAREAGVSKATLYAHFSGKEKLFAAVVAAECARHSEMMEQVEAEKLPIDQALMKIGLSFSRFLLRPDVLAVHRVVVGEGPRAPELARIFYEAGPTMGHNALTEFLGRAVERGELHITDCELAAELFFSMMKGRAQLRGLLGMEIAISDAEIERHVAAAVALFLAAYGRG